MQPRLQRGARVGSTQAPPQRGDGQAAHAASPLSAQGPRCFACHATSRLPPAADGAAFVCRLARCRDAWVAQRMRSNAAARASNAAEPPSNAAEPSTGSHGVKDLLALEAFRRRPAADQ